MNRNELVVQATGEQASTIALEDTPSPEMVAEYEERHGRVLALKQQIGKTFWEIGEELKAIRDKRLYRVGGYGTFEEYLGSTEISIARSTAFGWIGLVEGFSALNVQPLDIVDIPWTKLQAIQPVVKEYPQQVQEWLAKARALSRSDLYKELREHRGLKQGQSAGSLFLEELGSLRSYLNQAERALEAGQSGRAAELLELLIATAKGVLEQLRRPIAMGPEGGDHA